MPEYCAPLAKMPSLCSPTPAHRPVILVLTGLMLALANTCTDSKQCTRLCERMGCVSTPQSCFYGCPDNGCCCCGQNVDRRLGLIPKHHQTGRKLSSAECKQAGQERFEWKVPSVWYARRLTEGNSTDPEGDTGRTVGSCETHCPIGHLCFSTKHGRGFPSNDYKCPSGYTCRNLLGPLKSSLA